MVSDDSSVNTNNEMASDGFQVAKWISSIHSIFQTGYAPVRHPLEAGDIFPDVAFAVVLRVIWKEIVRPKHI